MHELAITNTILDAVLRHARREKAHRVHSVTLEISELSDLKSLWLQRYFSELAAGTVAAGAELRVESVAPEFRCNSCGEDFAVSLQLADEISCSRCGSSDCSLVHTPAYVLEAIEVS